MTGSRESGRHAVRHPRPAARWFRISAQTLAAVLSTVIVVGSGWAWSELRTFNANVAVGAAVAPATTSATATGDAPPTTDLNVLLLGNDSRAGATPQELAALGASDDGGSLNTDTMLLVHLPAGGGRASAISFPRDSYVDIPGYRKNKLNAAYPDGYETAVEQGVTDETARQSAGIAVLIATLGRLTGVHIDHYIQVDLLGFYRISIALNGVEVCLKAPAKESNSGINLPAGRQTIEGKQALAFVRQRYGFPDGRGDLDRITRQQYFLSAVLRKVLSAGTLLNPATVSDLLDAVSSSLLVDSGLQNGLLGLASRVAGLSAGETNFYTIPVAGDDNDSPVGAVLVVDPAAVQAFVQQTFSSVAATSATPSGTTGSTASVATTPPPTAATTVPGATVTASSTVVNAADAGCIY